MLQKFVDMFKNAPRRVLILGAVVGVSISIALLALAMGWVHPGALVEIVEKSGSTGMLVYVVVAVIIELLWLPRMWVLFGGGILFGPVLGVMLSLVSDTISAMICYFAARGAGRAWVEKLVASRPKAQRIIDLLAHRRGGLTVAIMRVVPIAHYTLVSYTAGLTGVAPRAYIIGNTIGLVPGAALYATVGSSAVRDPQGPVFYVSAGILLLAFVATAIFGRKLMRGEEVARPEA